MTIPESAAAFADHAVAAGVFPSSARDHCAAVAERFAEDDHARPIPGPSRLASFANLIAGHARPPGFIDGAAYLDRPGGFAELVAVLGGKPTENRIRELLGKTEIGERSLKNVTRAN